MRVLLVALLLFSNSAFAEIRGATIYIVPWNTLTRVALSAEDVRRTASVRTEILDEHLAKKLANWLANGDFRAAPNLPVRDLRLVIDIESEDGSTDSYYANRAELLDVKSGRVRKIDERFRSRFASFL